MNSFPLRFIVPLCGLAVTAFADVHYVDLNCPTSTAPYTNWAIAAEVIQDAVDAADAGDVVLVTNGVYRTGGRMVVFGLSNRVALTKPLTLHSVNGPEFTVIEGFTDPQTKFGDSSVRCVLLTNGAVLVGFTVTNGSTKGYGYYSQCTDGGGIYAVYSGPTVSNCVIIGNHAWGNGGGANACTLIDCQILSNEAVGEYGLGGVAGGAEESTLRNCTLANNSCGYAGAGAAFSALTDCIISNNFSARDGGGLWAGSASNCLLVANTALSGGGGSSSTALTSCTLIGNRADGGGGAWYGTLYRCSILSNSASSGGGGTCNGQLLNCILLGNSAHQGGGALTGLLTNCTVVANSADEGGGTWAADAANCVIYHNSAATFTNSLAGNVSYCCVTDALGEGNFTDPPLLIDLPNGNLRPQSNSPCINAGKNTPVATGIDLDGNPRVIGGTVDVGAYEFLSPRSLISYAWLSHYGLPQDGSADFADPDADGLNNWQEWRCATDPTNSFSVLKLLSAQKIGSALTLKWQSIYRKRYSVERASTLGSTTNFRTLATNIFAPTNTTTYVDTNAPGPGPFFYRIGVQ